MNLSKSKEYFSSLIDQLSSPLGFAPLLVILAVAVVAIAIPTTVILTQQEQDNRQSAQTSSGVFNPTDTPTPGFNCNQYVEPNPNNTFQYKSAECKPASQCNTGIANGYACSTGSVCCIDAEYKGSSPNTTPTPTTSSVGGPGAKPNPVTNIIGTTNCQNGVKKFDITWTPSSNAISYNVKIADINWGYDITGGAFSGTIGTEFDPNTTNITVSACNEAGCTDSAAAFNTGPSCSTLNAGSFCIPNPSGGYNICSPNAQSCTGGGGSIYNNGSANNHCAQNYGSGSVCCFKANSVGTPTPTPKGSCQTAGNSCSAGQTCCAGLVKNWGPGSCICSLNNSIPANTPTPTFAAGGPGAGTGQPCTLSNPNFPQGSCLLSTNRCVPSRCGGGNYFCTSGGTAYCPGVGGVNAGDNCATCPNANPTSAPLPENTGNSCGGAVECGPGLFCGYSYSLNERFCCPAGKMWCDRVDSSGNQIGGCVSPAVCKAEAGGGSCEKKDGHCYGNDSICCSGNCQGTGGYARCN